MEQQRQPGASSRRAETTERAPTERVPAIVRPFLERDSLRFALQVVPFVVLLAFVFVPLLATFIWSVAHQEPFGMRLGFTFENYVEFVDSYRFGVFIGTIKEGLVQVVLALLFGFPIAYYTGVRKRHSKYTFPLLLLFAVPFLTSYILRTLSWIAFLGNEGVINSALMAIGITTEPLSWLLYSRFAVRVSLVASYLPFMIFPAWLAMARISDEVLQASSDLGATPLATIRHVILPLAMPGLVIGSVFVFVGVLGESVVPVILGGGNISLIATVIDNSVNSLQIARASAVSVIVLVFALVLVAIWDLVFGLEKVGEI